MVECWYHMTEHWCHASLFQDKGQHEIQCPPCNLCKEKSSEYIFPPPSLPLSPPPPCNLSPPFNLPPFLCLLPFSEIDLMIANNHRRYMTAAKKIKSYHLITGNPPAMLSTPLPPLLPLPPTHLKRCPHQLLLSVGCCQYSPVSRPRQQDGETLAITMMSFTCGGFLVWGPPHSFLP